LFLKAICNPFFKKPIIGYEKLKASDALSRLLWPQVLVVFNVTASSQTLDNGSQGRVH